MSIADLTPSMVIIVIVGVFIGSFMDGIAGGGGIITVPTYLLAGLNPYYALGTNKLSACIGTFFSTARFARKGFINWKLGIPSIIISIIGSHFGTRLQLSVPENYLKYLLLVVLPIVAVVILKQRKLPEEPGEIDEKKRAAIVFIASFIIGGYDGFYGPGTGTFLLLIFCNLAKMDVRTAGGNMKIVNLGSNIGAMITSLINGKVFVILGLLGAAASMGGHYLGAGLAIKNGSKIVKPAIIIVLVLLAIKVISEL